MSQSQPEGPATGSVRAVSPELVVARLRSHGRALFWPCLVLLADFGLLGFFGGSLAEPWQNWVLLAVAVLVGIMLFLFPLIAWLSRNYTVTTRRIVLRGGLFVRTRQELLHSRGYDITLRRNPLQIVFGSGDVLINTGLDRPVVLRDVPGAALVLESLGDLMEHSVSSVASRRQQDAARPLDETTVFGSR